MATSELDRPIFGSSLSNHFLIAMPGLTDSPLANCITYICEHGPEGAMGLVVNRTLDICFQDVFEQMDLSYSPSMASNPVLAGGPVNKERGFILHPTCGEWQSTIQVSRDIAVTASRDIITAIAHGEGPHDAQFMLGYAGWGAGQLEQEIKGNSWLTVPADMDILFRTPVEQRWAASAKALGVDLNLMSTQTGHA